MMHGREQPTIRRDQIACAAATIAATAGTDSAGASSATSTATEEMKSKDDLHSEIRYAIRLAERTARLYRRVQTCGTALSIIGGSAVIGTIMGSLPHWLTLTGLAALTIAGAVLIAIRPGDKVAQNDADARRFQGLIIKFDELSEAELQRALEEARIGCAPEVEPLRDVAYNDVAIECSRPEFVVPLRRTQRFLAALA